jgi:hypothetical protein
MNNNTRKLLAIAKMGSVNDVLQKFNPQISLNEGNGKYQVIEVESPSSLPTNGVLKDIIIPLTNINVHIVEFGKSFIVIELEVFLAFPDGMPFFEDGEELPNFAQAPNGAEWRSDPLLETFARNHFMFFGWKSSTDLIASIKVRHRGIDIGTTLATNCQIVSFLYNLMKPKGDWENKHA